MWAIGVASAHTNTDCERTIEIEIKREKRREVKEGNHIPSLIAQN